ncbi:hypothetical protein SISSUDRAFT_1049722 [Sistotremastrum suecicum HHB10207 ss-3]|uniref:Uncharacterized protein n=1 Tax=Sistotremastrum suecicum HHB10207 ss-3 TaxID=1314776 RepID=A0A166BNF8_9AGAM|nr:hypothetical protein SISSUDRAFT_1049722 [Sistotremastrum suecicum HHB10207 ss-3]
MDKKESLSLPPYSASPIELREKKSGIARWLKIGALVSLSMWYLSGTTGEEVKRACVKSTSNEFSWDKLTPSTTLDWVECFEKFQCTRLEVPLDYAKPEGKKAAVAVIRLPSKYPVGHKKWRGPILYNPGGPGGSGVGLLQRAGESFSGVIGDDYDHVSFDPRGIGATTPPVNAFPTPAERATFNLREGPLVNETADALAVLYAGSDVLGQLVELRSKESAEHVSTAVVARDMLSITRAYGREKLLYWGFSYGTVLGITYASMFPDNVERIIVDGVVDTYNYYQSAWSNNLLDTDKILPAMAKECSASSACPLHESTPKAVETRIHSIIASLKTNPLPVVDGDNYGVVDYKLAWNAVFRVLYSPYKAFPGLASALADIEKGDGRALYRLGKKPENSFECQCGDGPQPELQVMETTLAVACGDGEDVTGENLKDLERFYEELSEMSSFANVWTHIHAGCVGWRIRPTERYSGRFEGNTSFPLLLIGNTADPVTPLWAAKKMSKGFKDAVVLTQNSSGHCSLAATSACTAKYIREYFRDGTLPPEGTVCEIEDHVFPPDNISSYRTEALSVEDAQLRDAMRKLNDVFEVPRLGHM